MRADRALDRPDQEPAVLRAGVEQVALEEEQHRQRVDDARERLGHEARLEQRHGTEPQAVAPREALGRRAGGVDDDPGRDLAGRGVHRRDPAAVDPDSVSTGAAADVDAGRLETQRQREHHPPRVDLVRGGLVEAAVDGGARENRRQPAGLAGVEQLHLGRKGQLSLVLLLQHPAPRLGDGGEQQSGAAHADVVAGLVLDAVVEVHAVGRELRFELARPVTDEPGSGVGRLLADGAGALEQHDVGDAALAQMQRGAGAEDAAPDHDGVGHQVVTCSMPSRPQSARSAGE